MARRATRLLLPLLLAALAAPSYMPPLRQCSTPAVRMMATLGRDGGRSRRAGDGRRTSRVGQLVRSELATVIRNGDVNGRTRIPEGLTQLISIIDVNMSPDLRNARVKVSIIGDRKDKISAVRWLRGNVRELRHELAQRMKHVKRVPVLSFTHVDVGGATDVMVKLAGLREEADAAAAARGEGGLDEDDGGLDFGSDEEDAWDLEGDEEVIDDFDEDGGGEGGYEPW